MDVEAENNELSQWFSTYGFITAERILGKYQIKLAHNDLIVAIKRPISFYHRLLEVPLKNVLNGIVLQQANDYHIYAQKLFIDYLLSGESSKDEAAQGAATREALENERQELVTLGDAFHQVEGKHDYLIASSQATLIKITRELQTELEKALNLLKAVLKTAGFTGQKSKISQAISHALIYCDLTDAQSEGSKYVFVEIMNEILKVSLTDDLKEKMVVYLSKVLTLVLNFSHDMGSFIEEAQVISEQSNGFRTQFYDTIIRVLELIKLLPEYKIDADQDLINREPLYFDKSIGET